MATVLVPLDGSSISEQALPFAATLAHGLGMELEILHVIDPFAGEIGLIEGKIHTIDDERRQLTKTATEYLKWVTATWAKTGISVRFTIKEGGSGPAIIEQATAQKVAYLVMTTHAKTGLTRLMMGSVADYVLRESPCPAVLIRPQAHPSSVVPYLVPIRRILVPLDGSPFAEQAIPQAIAAAKAFHSEVHLYRVVHLTAFAPPVYGANLLVKAEEPLLHQHAEAYLHHQIERLADSGVTVHGEVGIGEAADAILNHTPYLDTDLVVMTTRARMGIARTVLGSTADRVVREGSCPVLLIRPQDENG